jgi:hypothetical protein
MKFQRIKAVDGNAVTSVTIAITASRVTTIAVAAKEERDSVMGSIILYDYERVKGCSVKIRRGLGEYLR